MKIQPRYIKTNIIQDLKKKMVFVGGPRQVGKTTLAKTLLGSSKVGYLNWDIAHQREAILQHELPNAPLWIFDEIHKYKDWRNYLKGVYDQFHETHQILVTGSARLDLYRHGGDSLQGRYHYLRLHPLSVAELKLKTQEEFNNLLNFSGFPEPYYAHSEIEARRWSSEYRQRLIQDDLVSLEKVQDLSKLELLMLRLPELVGSPLSINALREDLQVSHKAVSQWLVIFEKLYAIFRVSPFGAPFIRAVKQEQKHYHYDWALIKDKAARLENLVGSHLLKWVQYLQDTQAREIELRYFRDTDGREVDFIIEEDRQPILAVEVKWAETDISKSLRYFKNKFPSCKALQLYAVGNKNYISRDDIYVCHAMDYLSELI